MSKAIIGVIIVAAIVAMIVGGVMLFDKKGDLVNNSYNAPVEEDKTPKLDPDQGEYEKPVETEGSGGIAIPGWNSITLPAGKKDVTVDLPNPEANSGKYYLTFELRLKDTGEVLYTSGLVSPGLYIQKITLSRALDVGTYNAVIHVQPYKMGNELTATNNADMETKLIVV